MAERGSQAASVADRTQSAGLDATHYGVEVSGLRRISDHVYWLPPAQPDRPSLCAVVARTPL